MSRSYRKPVSKVKNPQEKRTYNRIFKNRCRQITNGIKTLSDIGMDELVYPVLNEVYEYWSFCDYELNFIGRKLGGWHEDWRRRIMRK